MSEPVDIHEFARGRDPVSAADVEAIARAFHESYERQAPDHSYKTRKASAVPWEDVPADNKALMRAVVADLLDRGVIAAGPA